MPPPPPPKHLAGLIVAELIDNTDSYDYVLIYYDGLLCCSFIASQGSDSDYHTQKRRLKVQLAQDCQPLVSSCFGECSTGISMSIWNAEECQREVVTQRVTLAVTPPANYTK